MYYGKRFRAYILATSTMPSLQVSSESFNFSISLQDNIKKIDESECKTVDYDQQKYVVDIIINILCRCI
jgi:hypothetical protein